MAFLAGSSPYERKPPGGFVLLLLGQVFCPAGGKLAWLTLIFLTLAPLHSQGAPSYPPAQVKAVFIFNFAQSVEWPAPAFENENSPVVIGIVGDRNNPVAEALEQVVKNEKIRNRSFSIVYYPDVASARKCHILYFASGVSAPSPRIFADLQQRSILTIGETEDTLRNGGVIRFVTERTIRLRIHLKAARASGLTISSKLLRLAEVVNY
jgi:hypothetical protein